MKEYISGDTWIDIYPRFFIVSKIKTLVLKHASGTTCEYKPMDSYIILYQEILCDIMHENEKIQIRQACYHKFVTDTMMEHKEICPSLKADSIKFSGLMKSANPITWS